METDLAEIAAQHCAAIEDLYGGRFYLPTCKEGVPQQRGGVCRCSLVALCLTRNKVRDALHSATPPTARPIADHKAGGCRTSVAARTQQISPAH